MKILFLTLEYPPQKGGVASYYQGLTKELENQGHQVEVFATNLLARYFWPRWLKTYFILKKAISEKKPDFIFIGQILPLGIAAYLLRQRAPYVVFTHGMDILMVQKSKRKQWLAKKIFQNAKLIIANSKFTKNLLTTRYSLLTDKIAVVYPCPDLRPNDVLQKTLETLQHRLSLFGKKIIISIGRLVERKGQDMVLKALPEIIKEIPDLVYLIIGQGPALAKLQQFTALLNLQPYVRFLGGISEEEKNGCLAFSDILVMPARQIKADVEGFGMVFLEAGLFKKPSVGGQSGGVPEAILDGQTGLLVDPLDSLDIAQAIISLLKNNKLRQEMGEKAFERIQNEFIWSKQIAPLLKILK